MDKDTSPRVLIIGMDGATPTLIIPWAREGKLPNIARLMLKGSYGELLSTIPPITPPAWTSFMTGVNPGKHGIFDFIDRAPGSYNFRYINARMRKVPSIWQYLSRLGLRVGVLNVPMTFPPEEVNGFMISGLDAPDERSAVYPIDLYEELVREVGGFQLDIRHLGNMKTDELREFFLKEVQEVEEQRVRVLNYLQQKYVCDVLMIVFNATDQLQHHFWHYMDPSHPKHDPMGAKRFGGAILKIYNKIDELIGRLLEEIPPRDAVILMSDHGAGPTSKYYLHTNFLLEEIDLLRFKKKSFLVNITERSEKFLKSHLADSQKKFMSKLLPSFREKIENYSMLGAIDWKYTKAFAVELTGIAPFIWVNTARDFPEGSVWSEKERVQILKSIRDAFNNLKDPRDSLKIGVEVFSKDEIYNGPYLFKAPDLIPAAWSDKGFNLKNTPSTRSKNGFCLGIEEGPLISGSEWSGTHKIEGFFLASGKKIRGGNVLKNMKIVDVFPTILSILGFPIPQDIDGTVIKEVLN